MPATLILGAAWGYAPEQLRWFVESLHAHGGRHEAILLVDHGNRALIEFLAAHGVQPLPIAVPPRWMPGPLARRRFSRGRMSVQHRIAAAMSDWPAWGRWRRRLQWMFTASYHHITNSRYWFFLSILEHHRGRYAKVLLTDVRDAVFQADPFADTPDDFLWVFAETTRVAYGTQRENDAWMMFVYGEAGLERVRGKPIMCSGTTMGSEERMLDYLRTMTDEVARRTSTILALPYYDQAIHNALVHDGRVPVTAVMPNLGGPIATLALEDPAEFRFDGRNRLVNRDGSLVALVHQFPCHDILLERLQPALGMSGPFPVT